MTLLLLLLSCKDTGEKVDSNSEDSADTAVDSNTAQDTDTGEDTDSATDTETNCWIDSDAGVCYDCELPTAPESDSLKFLNQCSDAAYAKFDNAARIPSSTWVPGTALPVVP